MKRRWPLILLGAVLIQAPKLAAQEEDLPNWTVTVSSTAIFATESGDGDINNTSGTDSFGGAVSLERYFGRVTVGVTGGAWSRQVQLTGDAEEVSATNYSAGGYVSLATRFADVSVSFDYGTESFETSETFIIERLFEGDPRAPIVSRVKTSVDTDYYTVGAGVSRSFGETTRIVPSVFLGWSKAATDISREAPFRGEDSSEGITGSLGVALGRDLSPKLSLYASGSVNAVQEESVTWTGGAIPASVSVGPRVSTFLADRRGININGQTFSTADSEDFDDSAIWAEVGTGVSYFLDRKTALAFDLSGSIGQDRDYVATGLSISRSF